MLQGWSLPEEWIAGRLSLLVATVAWRRICPSRSGSPTCSRLAAELADLIRRLEASDATIEQLKHSGSGYLANADAVARGLKHHETGSVSALVRGVKLPAFDRDDAIGQRTIWPPVRPSPSFGG